MMFLHFGYVVESLVCFVFYKIVVIFVLHRTLPVFVIADLIGKNLDRN